jgi:hypothetical protein
MKLKGYGRDGMQILPRVIMEVMADTGGYHIMVPPFLYF